MTLLDGTRIAGQKSVADWKAMKVELDGSNDSAIWKKAFDDFFKARLDSRYFAPIRAIEKMGQDDGEGFAIVTLHCSLIEFLASTLEGKAYLYGRKGDTPFEYSDSRSMFVSFLVSRVDVHAIVSTRSVTSEIFASKASSLTT